MDSKNTLQGSCTISRLVRNSTSAIQLLLATGLGQSQSLIADVEDVVVSRFRANKKCRAFVTVFDYYCHAVSSPSAEIERRPPATQLFNINRTSRVFFYTFEELRCGPPGAQSVRVSRNHRFLCRRPAPLGLPSSPLAIQCPYIKSAPWPASAPWPSNALLI